MRIATWNLERGGPTKAARLAQEEILHALGADILVLTEPPGSYAARSGVVTSPPLRDGQRGRESWVAILGAGIAPQDCAIPFERMAAAARLVIGLRVVIVYGSVLPWLAIRRQAPAHVREGEDYQAAFARVLAAQQADVVRLRRACDLLVWAGDFNPSLVGPKRGGSARGRAALQRCLDELDMVA